MNFQIVTEFPHPLMEKGKRPVISIYVDTHIKKPDRLENPIRFKNLVKEAQASLKDKEFKGFKDLFSLFKEMEEDALFWEGATESMAILGDEEECIVYKLPVNVKSLAIVSDSFYIKPLLRSFQSNGHYHVLGLNRDNFVLFEADRYGITEIPVDARDATMEGVLGTEKTAPICPWPASVAISRCITVMAGPRMSARWIRKSFSAMSIPLCWNSIPKNKKYP